MVGEALDEAPVEVCEPEEGLCKIYIYYILSRYLIHAYMPYSHRVTLSDVSQL